MYIISNLRDTNHEFKASAFVSIIDTSFSNKPCALLFLLPAF